MEDYFSDLCFSLHTWDQIHKPRKKLVTIVVEPFNYIS